MVEELQKKLTNQFKGFINENPYNIEQLHKMGFTEGICIANSNFPPIIVLFNETEIFLECDDILSVHYDYKTKENINKIEAEIVDFVQGYLENGIQITISKKSIFSKEKKWNVLESKSGKKWKKLVN